MQMTKFGGIFVSLLCLVIQMDRAHHPAVAHHHHQTPAMDQNMTIVWSNLTQCHIR